MEFTNEVFSLSRFRELDLVDLLKMLGHAVVSRRKNDSDYWYLSPQRNERTASFHVDGMVNKWYDFGLMAGGNPVDFLLRYHGCSVTKLLDRMNVSSFSHQQNLHKPEPQEGHAGDDSKLKAKVVRPLYAYPLKNYLHERLIPMSVADRFCKELSYLINGSSYYGIGFGNDAVGWEIRNQNFKQSNAPKDIICLGSGAASAHVFEGFMDFLSYKVLYPYEDPHTVDFVVLNGAGFFDRALPFLEQHFRVHLWLDRDVTGLAYRDYALSLCSRFREESGLYEKFKDLNDWLRHKG